MTYCGEAEAGYIYVCLYVCANTRRKTLSTRGPPQRGMVRVQIEGLSLTGLGETAEWWNGHCTNS